MRILYTLFSYFIAIRFFAKDNSKKTYLFIGFIVSLLVVLTDIFLIISIGIIPYIKASGWQILLSYGLFVIYTFATKTSLGLRRISFERKKKKKIKETISTSRSRGLQSIIVGVLVLIIGSVLLIIKIFKIYDVPLIVFIASFAGAIIMIIFGILVMLRSSEKMILLVWTDKLDVYSKNIEDKFSFNYMNVIRDISRYYIVEKLAKVYYRKDIKEIHYVWVVKTQNLDNYNIDDLSMEKENKYWYNVVVEDMYKLRGSDFVFDIVNNRIEKVTRR